jgi:hypothetical protein
MFRGLLRSPRGLTYFFSLTKSASWRTKLDRQLAVFAQWKLTSSVWRFFLTLIFQWAIIVLERALFICIWGLDAV